MEALVQEKILSSFVNEVSAESSTVQPINVDIKSVNVTSLRWYNTMTTNDGNYFIKYGGYPVTGSRNAIEIYSVGSLDNQKTMYIFDDIKINGNSIYIRDLKQDIDGRFYGIGYYYDGGENYNYYLVIFNNFIQDGYCKINKYYSREEIGTSTASFQNVTKVPNTGIYFILAANLLIKFEINILEGNKTNTTTVVENLTITDVTTYTNQLNVFKDNLIFTRLHKSESYQYEYTKAVIDVNEDLPTTVTLNQVYYAGFSSAQYVAGAKNDSFKVIIPWLNSSGKILFTTIDINGNVRMRQNVARTFNNNNLYAYLEGEYASVTDNNNIYLMYFDENAGLSGLTEFYSGTFSGNYSNTQILKQNNIVNLIGTAVNGAQQSIVSIKNIYSPNVTSQPYFDSDFCLPYYMNLYSNSNDNTSLIFSRDATARFYSENQITSTFILPNYLLNDGNIEKASVYGKTNYLLNSKVADFEKNKFESLYFNFIYNLNIIDNTNGLNELNQIGSNNIAKRIWYQWRNYSPILTKARITYKNLNTSIINLNIPEVTSTSVTFSFQISGNVVKIEYLSDDEKTVYATFRTNLTGTNTITQTIRVE